MKRRNFFKVITGFLVGVVGISTKAKSQTKVLSCYGKNGTLCSRCKFDYKLGNLSKYLQEHYIYWGSDSNNIESYFHYIGRKYVMVPRHGRINEG